MNRLRDELEMIRRAAREGGDREELSARLDALLGAIEAEAAELGRVREEARRLAAELTGKRRPSGGVEPPGPEAAPPTRQDRLGASTFVEKGWHLITQGDYAGARAALRRALELAPGEVGAAALLGWAQMLEERFDDAMVTFARVLQRDPANALARVNVGYICLRKRIFGEAIEHLVRVIRENGDRKATLYAHYYLGLVYLERGMYGDAIPFLGRAVELGPNLVEAWYELGRALWFSERPEDARGAWRRGAESGALSPWLDRCRDALDRTGRGEDPPRSTFA